MCFSLLYLFLADPAYVCVLIGIFEPPCTGVEIADKQGLDLFSQLPYPKCLGWESLLSARYGLLCILPC